ncbi:endoplasmic reticulum mannosyl-oligosaccharide 1,2-alpha-mannosidase-like [Clytia hemisphaerica]|uniref:alpha-1,2-Mannosidase n=1 Tax=Clytia hemisphaerica TaxID=252671 RepID=A0A7M5UNZ5_9CNID
MAFHHADVKPTATYVGISDTSKYDDNAKGIKKKSLNRVWRQLSRVQKMTVVMAIATVVLFFYVFFYKTSVSQVTAERLSKSDQPLAPIKNPRKSKFDREKYLEKIHKELDSKIRPIKRGPPKKDSPSNIKKHFEELEKIKKEKVEKKSDDGFKEYNIIDGERDDVKKEKIRLQKINNADPSTDFAHNPHKVPQTERQLEVIKAMKHAWKGYKDHAWGHDELRPIAKTYSEWFMLGLTIVDSLDTLWLMNMKEEYKEARDWVENDLIFDKHVTVNLFETTIRVLGGLLSIYHLSADPMYLNKASDLGERLMGAFKSSSSIPYSDVNLKDKAGRPPAWGPDSSLAEVATIQLEFNDLSMSLTNPRYQSAGHNIMLQIFSQSRTSGLAPIYINADSGSFRASSHITLGARGDSYYEYLLKQWLQGGKEDDQMKEEYLKAMDGVMKLLVKKSKPKGLTYVGELLNGRTFSPKMDHLVCFLPGTLALGYKNGLPESHMTLAKELIETCVQMYKQMGTGLSPEIAYFNERNSGHKDIIVKPLDAHNLLRPETVESLHVMYEITGDKKYQEYGWDILQAFNKHCKIPGGGYVSINDVRNAANPRRGEGRDKMESFFLGETLKYLYLLFSDVPIVPLDKFVFNTEAHPLPIHAR